VPDSFPDIPRTARVIGPRRIIVDLSRNCKMASVRPFTTRVTPRRVPVGRDLPAIAEEALDLIEVESRGIAACLMFRCRDGRRIAVRTRVIFTSGRRTKPTSPSNDPPRWVLSP